MNKTTIAALILLVGSSAALAVDPVNTTRAGLALDGYDPVAYFIAGEPTKGDPSITHTWNGATWRFANDKHRTMFKASPEHFAPKYGGYCAWAVSRGDTADIDPEAWKIVDGALYLNYSKRIQKRWEEDVPGHIAKADANWPKLLAD